MLAGKRREVVTVYRIVETLDAAGGQVRSLQPASTERASVTPISGRQFLTDGIEQSQADFEIGMTHPLSDTITESDVLDWGGVRLNVVSVEMIPGIRPWTRIRAKRGATRNNG